MPSSPRSIGIAATLLPGSIGSCVAGFLGLLLLGQDPANGFLRPAGSIESVTGTVIAGPVWNPGDGGRARRPAG